MVELTRRQVEVLATVLDSLDRREIPPTIREIGDALGISSTNGINDHLKALERKGMLVRLGCARGLKLTQPGRQAALAHRKRRGRAATIHSDR